MRLTGTFHAETPVHVWETTDRNGDALRAMFTVTGEWSVSTHGEGRETSVMSVTGGQVHDLSEIFQAACALQRSM